MLMLMALLCFDAGSEPLDLRAELDKFATVKIEPDLSYLKPWELDVLRKLQAVAKVLDRIYLKQVYLKNGETRNAIAQSQSPQRELLLKMFDLHYGPWDTLNGDRPFFGDRERPKGAGVYPEDMTKEEFESWLQAHPEDQAAFRSLYTVIVRDEQGLKAIPYRDFYREDLALASKLMDEAASLSQNESLKRFLQLRAKSFLSDEYRESEMAWIDLDGTIEVAVGPYEVYTDQLLGQKAFYEIFLAVRNPTESAKLDRYKKFLPQFEKHLPIPDEHKNFKRGTESPLAVVDLVCGGGDNGPGVQTIAFNLPNDEVVREQKGSKKVMLRNIMKAKFDQILKPMAAVVLSESQRDLVNFEDFFNEVLFHELAHGLGPGSIVVDGRETTVGAELQETYSMIEEGKADVMGVYNLLYLMQHGELDSEGRDALLATYFVGLFRSMRFGVHEAHGGGAAFQFSYLREAGAFTLDDNQRFFTIDPDVMAKSIGDLVRDVCMIQAKGDYQGAKSFLVRHAALPKQVATATQRMQTIPVDIKPLYREL